MNIQLYKQRLLDLEKALPDRIGHEADRLEAVPWTPYCLRHERLEVAASTRTPTL